MLTREPLSLRLALRLLWPRPELRKVSRPMRSAMMSLALSLLPLVLVLEVSDGMISGILARYMETSSGHLRVYFSEKDTEEQLPSLMERAAVSERLTYFGLEREGAALIFVRGRRQPVQLRGVEVDRLVKDAGMREYLRLQSGKFDITGEQVVLGAAIAEQLKVKVGDSVTLMTAAVLPGGRFLPKSKLLRVSGVVGVGYRELDKLWVFASLALADELLHPEASRQSVVLKVADPLAINHRTKTRLRKELNIHPTAILLSWKDLSQSLRQNFEVTQAILILTMSLIVLLAMSNISSSLIIMVLENHRQIGVIRACGGGPRLVLAIYLWAGGISAAVALIPGILLGLLLSWQINRIVLLVNVLVNAIARLFGLIPPGDKLDVLNATYYLEKIPFHIEWTALVIVVTATLLLSLLASFLPAWRASRLQPQQLIRSGY